jgi:hypothetical protein
MSIIPYVSIAHNHNNVSGRRIWNCVVFNDELAAKKTRDLFFPFSGDIATLSIEYSVEKRINIEGVLIPVNIRAMLNPKDNTWKFTLVTGFDFETKSAKLSN